MKLTLGPVLFDWKREDLIRFYDEVKDMPVDRVYLGEVVCAKKKGLSAEDIEAVGKKLEKAGKEVIVSSLAIVSNEDELNFVREICRLPFPVEANDMSAFNIINPPVSPFVKGGFSNIPPLVKGDTGGFEIIAGPHITTYNVPSIQFLQGLGIKKVVFPVELSRDAIKYNIENTNIDGEVFAHGKVPLAFSWRCYTSRAYGLNKTNCKHHCRLHPDGMVLRTIEKEPMFTVNGTSILSANTYTLLEFVEDLNCIGVSALRISPQWQGTKEVVDVFKKRIDGEISGEQGMTMLKQTSQTGSPIKAFGDKFCNGWYLGKAGKEYVAAGFMPAVFTHP
ncbi:MAG: U32 family peptidase [Deltaproteobacteria bacterium]|nr:U32 family peptidase [Deltaproteobacteria bacterium]